MKIEFYGETNVGSVRKENQDAYTILDKEKFFVVCDGMGGSSAGDFASKVAVEVVRAAYQKISLNEIKDTLLFEDKDKNLVIEPMLFGYVPIFGKWLANRILNNFQEKYHLLSGMGTTIVSLLLDKKYNIAHIFHVGDSRVYRFRNNKLELVTKDHSKIEELLSEGKITEKDIASSELKSMVVRVLGPKKDVEVDYQIDYVMSGDIYILCSDGLNSEIEDDTIENIVAKNANSMQDVCSELIFAANVHGGKDNVTVIAIKILSLEEEVFPQEWGNVLGKVFTVKINEQKFSSIINSLIKKFTKEIKTPVSEKAKEKGLFKNPIILVILFLILLTGFFVVTNYYKNKSYELKKAQQQKKLVSGMVLEIRTPNEDEIEKYKVVTSQIDKQWLIKDWYDRKEELTQRVKNITVVILSALNDNVVYKGLVETGVLELPLEPGKYKYVFDEGLLSEIEIVASEKFQDRVVIVVVKQQQ